MPTLTIAEYEGGGFTPCERTKYIEHVRTDLGMEVIEADSQTLLLDLDSPEDPTERLAHGIDFFNRLLRLGAREVERWRSKSGNWHVRVSVDFPLGVVERLLLEVCLGSDPRRALFGYARALAEVDDAKVSVLFRPREQASGASAGGTSDGPRGLKPTEQLDFIDDLLAEDVMPEAPPGITGQPGQAGTTQSNLSEPAWSPPARLPRLPFWIAGACYEGLDTEHVREQARKRLGREVALIEVKSLPYPANPRVSPEDLQGPCPTFCYCPRTCAGRRSCPRNPACSE